MNGQLGVMPGGKVRVVSGAARGAAPVGGQSVNLSEPFIRRPVMTAVLTVSVIVFGVLSYLRFPVNDLPVVDYPVISRAGELSRSQPRHRRQQHRHAARTAIHADQRAGTGDLAEHAGHT